MVRFFPFVLFLFIYFSCSISHVSFLVGVSEKDESNAVKVEPTENSEVSADCNVKETGSPEELVPVAKSGKRGCSRDEVFH